MVNIVNVRRFLRSMVGILGQSWESTGSKKGEIAMARGSLSFLVGNSPLVLSHSHAFSVRFSICARPQWSAHTQMLSHVCRQTDTHDRLMGSKAGSTSRGATTNLQRVRATGRFWSGFTLREPVDSKHSRYLPWTALQRTVFVEDG